VETATIQTVCECQAKLGAELDSRCLVIRGWATNHRASKTAVAPAHTMGNASPMFSVGWSCPFCTRNQLRSFDREGLSFKVATPAG
jgi:hypothetical protein